MGSINHDIVVRTMIMQLKPMLEEWIAGAGGNVELSRNTVTYGIRRYLNGSHLLLHVDRLPTHIISAILQIDQKVDEPWPLTIFDRQGNKQKVYLNPGEMLFYESAKLPHGRQFPLKGAYYDNAFIHFRIQGLTMDDYVNN